MKSGTPGYKELLHIQVPFADATEVLRDSIPAIDKYGPHVNVMPYLLRCKACIIRDLYQDAP